MKPVYRSNIDKSKQDDKNSESNNKPISNLKRRLSQNCALYTN